MKRLTNKKVLITGGSSGIGQAIAIAYAHEGATIAFSYSRNQEGAKETLQQIQACGNEGFAIAVDLGEVAAVYHLIQQTCQRLGPVDVLVNNAGMLTRHANFLDIPLEAFEQIERVNLRAPFVLTQEIAKRMKNQETGGSIINISSISAEVTTPGLTHYECSKAALHALTRGAASDLAPYNIRVNAIAPGLVATHINQAQRKFDPEAWQRRSARIPLGRAGHPDDIAGLAVFLASHEARWITGAIIPVDGGLKIASPFASYGKMEREAGR